MTRKLVLISAAAIVVAAAAVGRTQSADEALDPVRVAPDTHKIAFENTFVRVLEVRIPPGKTIRFKPGKNLRALD